METRRDESKKEGNYKGFCQSFYSGVREVKRTITRPFVLSSAWLLLSNTVMAKTNISSTVIMQYILHLIRVSKAGPKQPLSAFWLADKHQLVSSFETTAWMLISVSVIHTYNYKISNKLFVHVNTGGFLLFFSDKLWCALFVKGWKAHAHKAVTDRHHPVPRIRGCVYLLHCRWCDVVFMDRTVCTLA